MGRPPKTDEQRVLRAATGLLARGGVGGLTMAGLAAAAGVPVGSLYHRFPSREVITARAWLRAAGLFQEPFLSALDMGPRQAALMVVPWVREHPDEASVLLLYRREDLVRGQWPEGVRAEAHRLATEAETALRHAAKLAALPPRTVRFAVVDVPLAAVRPHLLAGKAVPEDVDELVRRAAWAVLEED